MQQTLEAWAAIFLSPYNLTIKKGITYPDGRPCPKIISQSLPTMAIDSGFPFNPRPKIVFQSLPASEEIRHPRFGCFVQ